MIHQIFVTNLSLHTLIHVILPTTEGGLVGVSCHIVQSFFLGRRYDLLDSYDVSVRQTKDGSKFFNILSVEWWGL